MEEVPSPPFVAFSRGDGPAHKTGYNGILSSDRFIGHHKRDGVTSERPQQGEA